MASIYSLSKGKGLPLPFAIFWFRLPTAGMGGLASWLLQNTSCICKRKQKAGGQSLRSSSEVMVVGKVLLALLQVALATSRPLQVYLTSLVLLFWWWQETDQHLFLPQGICRLLLSVSGNASFFFFWGHFVGHYLFIVLGLLRALSLSMLALTMPRISAILDLWRFTWHT